MPAVVTTASRSRSDMTAVTVPPTVAGTDSMRASGAASTAAIALLLACACWSWLLVETCVTSRKATAAASASTPAVRPARAVEQPPQPGPLSGPASRLRPGGGSCLVRRAAVSTRERSSGGGVTAVAMRQPGGGLPQPADLLRAGGAAGQVLLEIGLLVTGQRVKGVAAGQQVQFVTLDAHQVTPMQSRSRIRPSLIRVLMVPSGTPSSSATCGYAYPP